MIISFEGVSKFYKLGFKSKLDILSDFNFEISKGDFLTITGSSGCGKTTILRLIAGLSEVSNGEIVVHHYKINEMNQEQLALFRSAYVGLVFQDFQLIQTLTCLENVMLPAELAGDLTKEAYNSAKYELKKVGLDHRLNHYPLQLSGGEQQRTSWARAFVNSPSIIMADEPTANLDSKTQKFIINKLEETLNDPELTTIVSTHEKSIESLSTCKLVYNEDSSNFDFIRISQPPEVSKFEEIEENS